MLYALSPMCVAANSSIIPMTPLEQMSTLSRVAKFGVPIRIFSPNVERILTGLSNQTDFEFDYNRASTEERRRISQLQGERGAARYAAGQRWRTLLSPHGQWLPTGPDSVYWDPQSGRVRVIEAKGGAGRTGVSYGARQGTNKNTIRSAARVLISRGASRHEKLQAARIIKAAQRGQLTTGVVASRILSGRFTDPQLVGRWSTRNVVNEATRIQHTLAREHPDSRRFFRRADFLHNVDRIRYRGARLMILGSATIRSLGSNATQRVRLQRIGRVAGRWFVPLGVGLAGVTLLESHHELSSGLISTREFYRRSVGSTVLVVFTATGAIVGGPGLGIGAFVGASLGALAALPAETAADWVINRYYREFDHRQRRLVNVAVEEAYGVNPLLLENR